MSKESENLDYQDRLESAVMIYQKKITDGDKHGVEESYKKIVSIYNPMDFYHTWYEQYKYLFDSHEDFLADYIKVFATVLIGWTPRNKRKKSRYEGSGEFKNYFIGSLYHNYVNLIKADQAAKRNLTKQCPICDEWVNPISTHLINNHQELLWDYIENMQIDIDSLVSCPFCSNFKITKNNTDKPKVTELIKKHFLSKHSSLLFNRFSELYPGVQTISPKSISVHIETGMDEVDAYEITRNNESMISRLYLMDLSETQKNIVEQIMNGDIDLVYKPEKYKCTKDEWEKEIEGLREVISICEYE